MKFFSKYKLLMLGAFAGGLVGYLYYYFVGCAAGTCAITSKPLNSILYGALLGALLLNMFKRTNTQQDEYRKDY